MKVNDDKFQYVAFCKNKPIRLSSRVHVGSNEIMSISCVKLLKAYFDQKLFFDYHADELCGKAGRKLSVF